MFAILTRKPGRCGCSRSIANLKDVINGDSKRHSENLVNYSPRSIGSIEFINPVTHEVILNNSKCELKITSFGSAGDGLALIPGTLSPGGNPTMQQLMNTPIRRMVERGDGNGIGNSGHLGIVGKNNMTQCLSCSVVAPLGKVE
ncbi:hypothetical protein L1987_32557 [Smallanthus sonchifolius]|uniref:Uncharacterized protein n=1 Tax=Smallanthus sonchifolius TaxID=185202 RepID=A0ACB9HP81_9ASTR|nr:hypothetical protein L1987_32557 [Smallanthus sonchifolius]